MPDSTPSLPSLDTVLDQVKSRKNLILGILVVIAIVVFATNFVLKQMRATRYEPWRNLLLSTNNPPWRATKEDAATILEKVSGTSAEPLAAYFEALRSFNDDHVAAFRKLDALRQKFPDHYLWKVTFPSNSLLLPEPLSAGDRVMREIGIYGTWSEQHPAPESNPAPPQGNTVTLITDAGTIVLGMYVDQSPRSCAAFAKTAVQLKDRLITRVLQDKWVEIGQDEVGTAMTVEGIEADFPPYEINQLSHFRGSVAFNQRPFATTPFKGDLRVWLDTEFEQDGNSTVFATVINEEGGNLLKEISARERSTDRPGVLKSPVKIVEVRVEMPGLPPK